MVVDRLSAKLVDKSRDKKKADFFMVLHNGCFSFGAQSGGVIYLDFYSTVTDLARFRGLSTSQPRSRAM